ncbi:MAG: hypothetical protein M1360_01780 [Candidatus Marsarchaeota archaeon]|nr:hypothetical protein [Candidatus Marsarchaeota archaeon]MCL5418651.1 hypothetical protein [Candidatus Marsarchaeota archaeon]
MLFAIFAVLAFIELLAAVLIFLFKNVMHSIIMLAIAFLVGSLLFAALQQPLLALLQLFVIVGGVLTYFFIGVASAGLSKFKHTYYLPLAVLAIASFLLLAYASIGINTAGSNVLTRQMIANYVGSSISVLYVLAIVLFGVGLGAIELLKKLGAE